MDRFTRFTRILQMWPRLNQINHYIYFFSLCQKLLSSLAIWASGKCWSVLLAQTRFYGHNTMSTKFPHASRASGRALFTGPIGNWHANGVGPVLISQTVSSNFSLRFDGIVSWRLLANLQVVCQDYRTSRCQQWFPLAVTHKNRLLQADWCTTTGVDAEICVNLGPGANCCIDAGVGVNATWTQRTCLNTLYTFSGIQINAALTQVSMQE